MIELTDQMRERLASAMTDGCPVVAATVDTDGQPKLSFFGSTHVHSTDELAIWVRDPNGGTLRRLAANPRISFLYRNPAERLRWVFEGRARRVDDADAAAAIFENIHEFEQAMDPDRKGVAVVIELDRVTGRGIDMQR